MSAWADEPDDTRTLLLGGAEKVLTKRDRAGLAELERAATSGVDLPGLETAIGAAALLLGDDAKAIRVLSRVPEASALFAMAQCRGPGGMSRARSTLATAAKGKDATAEVLFLAALAFHGSGELKKADELLKRALEKAPSALDVAFAPDAAVALSRAVERALEAQGGDLSEDRARLSVAMLSAGRRAEAIRLAEKAGDAGLRVIIAITGATETSRTLERVDRILKSQPQAEDARVAKIGLLLRLGDHDRAKRVLEELPPLDDKGLEADRLRAEAEIALRSGKDLAHGLEAAESALRADPKNDETVALYVNLLLAEKKVDRAAEFTVALLKRKPKGVDPFGLLVKIHEARGEVGPAKDNRLRSQHFRGEKEKIEREILDRERVIRAVRDGEGGVGLAGLNSMRSEHPTLSLSLDLALARKGAPGTAHAARERVLAACGPRLRELLESRSGWDFAALRVAPYGETETVEAPLSAADPTRCMRR